MEHIILTILTALGYALLVFLAAAFLILLEEAKKAEVPLNYYSVWRGIGWGVLIALAIIGFWLI